jgi:HEPN domain-containing protein
MPLERLPPDDPREWLNRARSNLLRASDKIPGVYFEDLCFDAQQAAEKAIKAVLLSRGIDFPYVHDLNRLLVLLEQAGETIPSAIWVVGPLTEYAVTTRYPGMGEPVTAEEHAEAVTIAEAVLAWAERLIQEA